MNIYFYTYSKRINSTAQPSGGTSYTVTLKSPSSVISPTISIVWSGIGSPAVYNYAYIADYGRYYWVSDWTYADRQWTAKLNVDVLASFKSQIGSANKYVLRAASDYNADVLDNRYPAKSSLGGTVLQTSFGWNKYGDTTGGNIVVTIIGKNTVPSGNYISQAEMTPANFQLLINNLMDKVASEIQSAQTSATFGDVMRDLFLIPSRMTDDLMRYVQSVMWFPFVLTSSATSGSLRAGYHDVLADDKYTWVSQPVHQDTASINVSGIVPVGYDPWEYCSPYASYMLHFMPFGDIQLDSFDVINSTSIDLVVDTDSISGIAVLRIYANPGGEQLPRLLTTRSAQLGMKIPFGSTSLNIAGMVQGGVGIASAVSNYIEGSAGAGAIVGSVANSASLSQPQVYATGATGTGACIDGVASLWYRRLHHAALDDSEIGKPLCAFKTINALSGYVQCRDGDIAAPATSAELAQIESYLKGGFFYE